MNLLGHFWTLAPFLRYSIAPPRPPASIEWKAMLDDQVVGTLSLTGRLSHRNSRTIVVIVHGLGGSASSYYALRAAQAAARAGLDSLRLNLRGADRSGADYYHAGLTEDLAAALSSRPLEAYDRILLLGYSLGGNMALRYLAANPDPRITAAAAVCSPIDLATSARSIDQPRGAHYRRHVLRALKDIYHNVAKRRDVPLAIDDAMRIDTMEHWDDEVISPRYGFRGAEDYWTRTSACFVLGDIDVPTLFVAAERDPMVLVESVRPWLESADHLRRVITPQGGHVGFPESANLGLGTRGTVEDQVIRWMLEPA